jgi:tetratricopeptide (TPR) repeat protein
VERAIGAMLSSPMSKPTHSIHDRPSSVSDALKQAGRALQTQRPDEAERLASGVLKADRSNIVAARFLGTAMLMQGRADEAIAPLQRAARRSQDPAIETLLARAMAAVGRKEEALDLLQKTMVRRPPFPQAFLELGDQLSAIGRFEEGIAVFERGMALMPDAVVLRVGLGYLHLQQNDRAKARALFLDVRSEAPGRIDALVGLAKVMTLDGDYAEATECYRHVLDARPDDAATRVELGKCLLEMGKRDAGEASLRAAMNGAAELTGPAIMALATASHGRFFLRRSVAARFLRVEGN